MRRFLITKFVCSDCGNNLNLTCDVPRGAGGYEDNQPTGANMVENIIAIEPCKCKKMKLLDISNAVKVLLRTQE